MCVSSLILSKGITFCYAGLAGVVMRGRYMGLTLPNLLTKLYDLARLRYQFNQVDYKFPAR